MFVFQSWFVVSHCLLAPQPTWIIGDPFGRLGILLWTYLAGSQQGTRIGTPPEKKPSPIWFPRESPNGIIPNTVIPYQPYQQVAGLPLRPRCERMASLAPRLSIAAGSEPARRHQAALRRRRWDRSCGLVVQVKKNGCMRSTSHRKGAICRGKNLLFFSQYTPTRRVFGVGESPKTLKGRSSTRSLVARHMISTDTNCQVCLLGPKLQMST